MCPFERGSKPGQSSELPEEFPKHRLLLPPLEKLLHLLKVDLGKQYLIVISKTTGYLSESSYCDNVDGAKRKAHVLQSLRKREPQIWKDTMQLRFQLHWLLGCVIWGKAFYEVCLLT